MSRTSTFLPVAGDVPTRVDGSASALAAAAHEGALGPEDVTPMAVELDAKVDAVVEQAGPDTSPYRAGRVINERYRLLRPLGRGGMGEVWSAQHLSLNTAMAIKFLTSDDSGERSRIALERFRFEAQVSAQIGMKTNHVVTVHDAGLDDDSGPYLVMEYVRGETLRSHLTKRGPMSLSTLATLLDQLALAMTAAHDAGIIHRDLKPSNLLLCDAPDGSIYLKVADFGIAQAIRADFPIQSPQDSGDGFVLGSPSYMAPEQLSAGVLDARTDLWSIGVLAYESLTGRLPFIGRTVPELISSMSNRPLDLPSSIRPELSAAVDAWFEKALAKDKNKRFKSAREMATAFRAAIASATKPKQSPWRVLAAVAAAITAVGITASASMHYAHVNANSAYAPQSMHAATIVER